MDIPGIKSPLRRRLHLLWITPYMVLIFVPYTLWYGLKETGPGFISSLRDVWRGNP